jgi:GNAT superfamily N-acetyltransferase
MSNKRLLMFKELAFTEHHKIPNSRMISKEDGILLGQLMYDSYKGTIDYEGETLEQSIEEMKGTLGGKYGEVNFPASFIVLEGKLAISAVIFVDFKKENMPLLAFTMTHPEFQGRKMSQALIKMGMNVLQEQGNKECCLVVTEGNQPAQSIYDKLGFKVK